MVTAIILPQFSVSASTRAATLASRMSAMSSSIFERCDGVVRFQLWKALAAAATAASTSAAFETGISAKASPVAGFTISAY